jgi:hypothetical protein
MATPSVAIFNRGNADLGIPRRGKLSTDWYKQLLKMQVEEDEVLTDDVPDPYLFSAHPELHEAAGSMDGIER